MLPDMKLALKERASILYVEYGQIDVLDGSFVLVDKTGIRTHIPVGGLACLMLEPGTRITHAACTLAARVGTLLIWVGEAGVRLYSAGQPGGSRSEKLLHQARLALDERLRLHVVRKMYEMRFGDSSPSRRSIEQLRGIEGARVKEMYKILASKFGVKWHGRSYDPEQWQKADLPNRCISAANACLYGLSEAAIITAGYSPAIGFVHVGRPQSFVYDIADLYKFETVVPAAFWVASQNPAEPERAVRAHCRDAFRKSRILDRIIPDIERLLDIGSADDVAT